MLFEAVERRDLAAVKTLLENNAIDPNEFSKERCTMPFLCSFQASKRASLGQQLSIELLYWEISGSARSNCGIQRCKLIK